MRPQTDRVYVDDADEVVAHMLERCGDPAELALMRAQQRSLDEAMRGR